MNLCLVTWHVWRKIYFPCVPFWKQLARMFPHIEGLDWKVKKRYQDTNLYSGSQSSSDKTLEKREKIRMWNISVPRSKHRTEDMFLEFILVEVVFVCHISQKWRLFNKSATMRINSTFGNYPASKVQARE